MDEIIDAIPTNWSKVIKMYPNLKDIENFLEEEKNKFGDDLPTFPHFENIFKCFHYFNTGDTKVVILGQDPYHGKDHAIGLCFGVSKKTKIPPSLRNIQNELVTNVGIDLTCKTLEYWAKQGVLLLNAALTVRMKSPASHMKIWLPFTKYIIDHLNQASWRYENMVFVAWGAFAYDKLKNINQKRHHLIVSSHPSPLSARRKYKEFPAFLGSKPFSKINALLTEKIHW